jgi:hypothetical protein
VNTAQTLANGAAITSRSRVMTGALNSIVMMVIKFGEKAGQNVKLIHVAT